MRKLIILALLLSVTLCYSIVYKKSGLDVIPTKLFAGEIHYSRIPVQYWEHRIQMVKALGLNALSVYVMWNYHEVEKGKFDYTTENKDLNKFLDLAEKYEMKVLFRPGPYVCAEWDFGGLPARLLNVNNLVIRANNKQFLQEVRVYFESLVPIINRHLQTPANPKGSIILLQIQNQYGFYGNDKSYIEAIRKLWADLKIVCDQYYVDTVYNLQKCHWTGANIGINDGISQSQYDYARTFEKTGYLLGGQIYTGWLTHWNQNWQTKSIQRNQNQFGFLMSYNHSYSMYMVHGGTNFGLTAGANAQNGKKYDFLGHVTSYDYDAPINEQGSSNAKYQALKALIKKYATWTIPAEPAPIKMIQIPRFKLINTASMLSNLGEPAIRNSSKFFMFETDQLKMYDQGFVVYETVLQKKNYSFTAVVHDYAIVYLDNVYIAHLNRSELTVNNFSANCVINNCTLRIIVQAMGHINFDHQMQHDYKGLIDLDESSGASFAWNMYKVPVDSNLIKWAFFNSTIQPAPTLLRAVINLTEVGDTYLDATELNKGYIWVNGRNLGRYWNRGPQFRLFCPGVWLRQGENTIHVFQLNYDFKQKGITGRRTLQLESQIKDEVLQTKRHH